MHKLMEYICYEMEELERKADKNGKLSMQEIEYLDKLAHIKKSILTAEEKWEESEYSEASGRSNRGSRVSSRDGGNYSMRSSSSYDGGSYAGDGSYAGSRRGNSGRSSENDFRMELEDLMQDAPNEQIKMKLQRMMSEI